MHGVILAGGAGTRLRADGVTESKPLVRVADTPQLVRLAGLLRALDCSTITAFLQRDFLDEAQELDLPAELRIVPCTTPSSLHTLALAVRTVPPGPIFCTLVDTVMRPLDWARVFVQACNDVMVGAEVVLAVTRAQDRADRPLYVEVSGNRAATRIGESPAQYVGAGVYAFAPRARRGILEAVGRGQSHLRSYLMQCPTQARTRVVVVPRVIDLDHASDLREANSWFNGNHQASWSSK
jgi:NDP-sugar pyrophosphorylase family protein